MRTLQELFFSTNPDDITDEEFEQLILPHMRAQRKQFQITEASGTRAPTTKRIAKQALPSDFSLKDLKF